MASRPHSLTAPSTPKPNRRRQNRSSDEEAYAGSAQIVAALPLSPPATEVDPNATRSPSSWKRVRRTRGSPEGSPPIYHSKGWRELQRIGMPLLTSLPAMTGVISHIHPLAQRWNDSKLGMASSILNENQVRWITIALVYRASQLDQRPEDQWPVTLLIFTDEAVRQYSDQCWAACQQLRTWLDTHGMAEIWLEMCDEDAARPCRSFPVDHSDQAVLMWPTLEGPIVDTLRSTDCLAMTLVRRGKEDIPNQNPITVFITIPIDSLIDWVSIREDIINILEAASVFDVAVEITCGRIWSAAAHFGFTKLPDDSWEKPARGGSSIGPVLEPEESVTSSSLSELLPLSSSTLGGFVEVCWEDGSWHTYGLTCHHAAFPATPFLDNFPGNKKSRLNWCLIWRTFCLIMIIGLLKWHQDGFRPADASKHTLWMSQPSLGDAKLTTEWWKDGLAEIKASPEYVKLHQQSQAGELMIPPDIRKYDTARSNIDHYQSRLDCAYAFLNAKSHLLGSVWAASGSRRTNAQACLDWALIDVSSRSWLVNTVSSLKKQMNQAEFDEGGT